MRDVDSPICLSAAEPVARGTERQIFLHPNNPGRVLKILDIRLPKRWFSMRNATSRMFSSVELRASIAEQKAQTRAFLRAPRDAGPPPFSRLFGYVETDLGWALEAERITEGSRALGPTLTQIAKEGPVSPETIALLNDVVTRIDRWKLRASDLGPSNFVRGMRDGQRQVVLVDGMGDIHAVPIRSWSDSLNRRANSRKFERMAQRLGLRWDAQAWCFSAG